MFNKRKQKLIEEEVFDMRDDKNKKGAMIGAEYNAGLEIVIFDIEKDCVLPSYIYYLCEHLSNQRSVVVKRVAFVGKNRLEMFSLKDLKDKNDWRNINELE